MNFRLNEWPANSKGSKERDIGENIPAKAVEMVFILETIITADSRKFSLTQKYSRTYKMDREKYHTIDYFCSSNYYFETHNAQLLLVAGHVGRSGEVRKDM